MGFSDGRAVVAREPVGDVAGELAGIAHGHAESLEDLASVGGLGGVDAAGVLGEADAEEPLERARSSPSIVEGCGCFGSLGARLGSHGALANRAGLSLPPTWGLAPFPATDLLVLH